MESTVLVQEFKVITLFIFTGVLFRFVTAKFGCRISVMLGGILATAGLALGVCVTELYEVYLCMGVLTGKYSYFHLFLIYRWNL